MSGNQRQKRVARARELASENPATADVLKLFVEIMSFGDGVQVLLEQTMKQKRRGFGDPIGPEIAAKFPEFLKMIAAKGPKPIAEEAEKGGKLSDREREEWLNAFWTRPETSSALIAQQSFLARAFLQSYAELVRERSGKQLGSWTPRVCPFCLHKPGSGVLRPLGDGGQRFLVCSFCSGEWEFRRILCAGCGEENELKLPVYAAQEFDHVRVECCDSCRCYIKTVDLTRNGLADPMVDEIASIPLDLWAQGRGYTKLQTNLMML